MSPMDPRERKEIMGQWGPRGSTHREEQQARKLAEDLEGSPVRGRPILRLSSPFRISVEGYVTALGGPLPYMTRLREIEQLAERHEARLTEAWRELEDTRAEIAPASVDAMLAADRPGQPTPLTPIVLAARLSRLRVTG